MSANSARSKNWSKICCPSSIASVLGFTDWENTKRNSGKRYKQTKRHSHSRKSTKLAPNSVRKIRLYPTVELHKVWKQWLAAYRQVFNWALEQLKNGFNLKDDLQKAYRNSLAIPDWVRELPGHQAQEACDEAIDAYRQGKANGGEAKFKSCRSKSQTIQFKVGNFKNGTWYPKKTKGLTFKASKPLPSQSEYGTELVYQRGKWYGCFPAHVETEPTKQERVIALDPGNRAFLTGYDGENVLEIGKGDIGRINRLCSHLDQLLSRATKSPFKRQRHKMRKAADRIREKIQCLVKDLHSKVASFLIGKYKLIFLPTFATSKMVLKSSRKINRKTVRNMLSWSHYKFAQHLTQMAARKNVLVVRCNESYTSKTCTNCGHRHNKLGGSKIFRCPECKMELPRDIGGGRNIMIRSLQAAAFTSNGDAILVQDA
ncbi:transposase [Moorena sp. SIO3I6]|uniref:RNA-guided endonuclease InsQ/TnpB family protein n=1 Tax=Moorena sp. SIO3I6 TaxID=2607831 RepID=UPI0025D686B1|nr:transposase [Moorena sp. SIO3I6]